MTGELEVRPYRESDRDFVLRSLFDIQAHEASLHDSRKPAAGEDCECYLAQILESTRHNDGAILIAVMDGTPAGFVCFWIEEDFLVLERADSNRFGYVSDIHVGRAFRKQGIAGRLLAETERALTRDKTITRVRIASLAANSRALSAYEAAGFSPYEIVLEKTIR